MPYAFTEQGIYMLMTVLKGEQAVAQSKALIRLFKRLKDYAVSEGLLTNGTDVIPLALQTAQTQGILLRYRQMSRSFLARCMKCVASLTR
jgi:hypothetical protein